jgi:hypothetical protein
VKIARLMCHGKEPETATRGNEKQRFFSGFGRPCTQRRISVRVKVWMRKGAGPWSNSTFAKAAPGASRTYAWHGATGVCLCARVARAASE